MIDKFVENVLGEVVKKYPHLEHPVAMKAVISSALETGEEIEVECEITDKTSGEKKESIITFKEYEYTVNVADNDGMEQGTYPPFPGIKSRNKYEVGTTVTIVFTGGELSPVIVEG